MATIFHIALAADWAAAQEAGAYTTSTRGMTLAEVGFIHASRGDQWTSIRDRFYADVDEPLLLLRIDTRLLDVPVVEEPGEPGSAETFPHVYGPLPLDAVTSAIPLPATGPATEPAAPGTGPAAPGPGDSFTTIFLREMTRNVALAFLVVLVGTIGIGLGLALGQDWQPGVGGVLGVVIGLAGARVLYRRRSTSG